MVVRREDRDRVAVLQIARGKANALNPELLRLLSSELASLAGSSKALVLTGRGGMFSAGLDLPEILQGGSSYIDDLIDSLNQLLQRLIDLPIPSVAAINGHAIAGGFILACACDFRLMSRGEGTVGLTEHRLGVPFPPLALEIVRTALGEVSARRLALRAELVAAEQAAELGLVDELAPPKDLVETAIDLADRLGEVPRAAYELTKRQLLAPLRMRLERLGAASEVSAREVWMDAETREAMKRFVGERLG